MASPVGSETHHLIIEVRFKYRLYNSLYGFLNQFVLITVNAQRSGFTIVFRNLHSSGRLRMIRLTLHPLHQIRKILLQIPAVVLFGNPVNSHGFVCAHLLMTTFQHLHVDQMPNGREHHVRVLSG